MISGPNGSGKSTLIVDLQKVVGFGYYINADDIEREILSTGTFDLESFQGDIHNSDLQIFLKQTGFAKKSSGKAPFSHLRIEESKLVSTTGMIDSYGAAAIAEFLRNYFIEGYQSFSFETVMSHSSKLLLLQRAKKVRFRVYLYFIATESPVINIGRVEQRVETGGHAVDPEKIEQRYYRSLDLLYDAISITDRAYLFDNSTEHYRLFAEVTNGRNLRIVNDQVPGWFVKYIEKKM